MFIINSMIEMQKQLKKIRKEEFHMPQWELAAKIGVSQQLISKFEKCDGTTSSKILFDIANFFGYDVILKKRE